MTGKARRGQGAYHMMKQHMKLNQAKWNARECGRLNESNGMIWPLSG